MYCDVIFCQMEAMKGELEYAASAEEQSDTLIKHLEDKLRESNYKVLNKTCIKHNTKGQNHTLNSQSSMHRLSSLLLNLVSYAEFSVLQNGY